MLVGGKILTGVNPFTSGGGTVPAHPRSARGGWPRPSLRLSQRGARRQGRLHRGPRHLDPSQMAQRITFLRAIRRNFSSTVVIMEALKMSNWSDDKLDRGDGEMQEDFARLEGQIKEGFAESDKRFIRLEAHLKESIAVSNERFARLEEQILATRQDMKEGFERVDKRFETTHREMREGFARVDKRFEKVDERFAKVDERLEKMDERFDALYRVLVASVVVLLATTIGALLT